LKFHPGRVAVERVTKATQSGRILGGTARCRCGAATGAVFVAPFGILTGEDVAGAAGKESAV